MGHGLRRSTRALVAAVVIAAVSCTVTNAGAASQNADAAMARAGVFVASDFPASFHTQPGSNSSTSDTVRLAKGVDGCGPYVTLLKASIPLPQARSSRFGDAARSVSNEVDVYASERAASAALTLYAKSSVVGCIENLVEKQILQDPKTRASLDDVVAKIDRQDIARLGDDSVVYEGSVVLTATDGSTSQIGVGSAVVRVGRAVDVVTYTTSGTDLTDLLTPAIDASVARLRAALAPKAT
jgi:hypothetical protein